MNYCFDYDFVMFVPLCDAVVRRNVTVCDVDIVRAIVKRGNTCRSPISYMVFIVIYALRRFIEACIGRRERCGDTQAGELGNC